jgi:hypothetical protein
MENNWIGRRKPTSLVWPATLLGAVGLCFWLAHGAGVPVLPAAALVSTVILGAAWLSRARAARRLNAAVDAYAAREIARERRRPAPRNARGFSTRGGSLPGGLTQGR